MSKRLGGIIFFFFFFHAVRSEKKKRKNYATHPHDMSRRYAGRRYAGLGPSRVRTRILPSTRRLARPMGVASQNSTYVCDNNFPSLVASLFSWRYLPASTSSFLHAAMNLRPPAVTASTHISAFNAIASQSPVMPNARMSLCTQSVHSLSPSHPVLSALHPQGFQT